MGLSARGALAGSGTFYDDALGTVSYTVRPTARRIIARWRGSVLVLTVPPGAGLDYVSGALARMAPRLLAAKPAACIYSIGKVFDFGDFRITIAGNSHSRGCRILESAPREFRVEIPAADDLSPVEKTVSAAMKKIARYLAPSILIPRAQELAAATGCRPSKVSVSSGRRVLGHCNSRGEIAISCVVLFLPHDLRDYIIYHEFAHLSEMNHSAAFHRICDSYCGGRERVYMARLRKFRFPVL